MQIVDRIKYSLFILLILSNPLSAEQRLVLGAKWLGAGWQGSNASGSQFNSDKGSQFGLNMAWQNGGFYTGLNLQSGNYNFTDTAPDQFRRAGSLPVGTDQIKQSEMDLLLGYYVWPRISVFVDIKSVTNQWQLNDYNQNFAGLGLGISGFNPVNKNWTLFGSLGFVSGEIKDDSNYKVGDGISSALEMGLVYTLSKDNYLSFGLKFRNYDLQSNRGDAQNYDINALFIAYSHAIHLD